MNGELSVFPGMTLWIDPTGDCFLMKTVVSVLFLSEQTKDFMILCVNKVISWCFVMVLIVSF